jgi:hypothetical protein
MENNSDNNSKENNSISSLINSINSNKQFSRLIIYSLNSLKLHLIVPNQNQANDNSIQILQSNKILK